MSSSTKVEAHARFPPRGRATKARQQVAAVCYRARKRRVEFLLVQTRGGRWIFPKGGAEPGITHAQSAALEALEEAGAHGRIEQIAFTRYAAQPDAALPVLAHLCEVTRLEAPQEEDRHPTWFPAEKAKQKLCERRASEFGSELARVVDRALTRIHRLQVSPRDVALFRRTDGLQKVRFEAAEVGQFRDELAGSIYRHVVQRRNICAAAIDGEMQPFIEQIAAPTTRQLVLRLGTVENGDDPSVARQRKITAINSTSTLHRRKATRLLSK